MTMIKKMKMTLEGVLNEDMDQGKGEPKKAIQVGN